MQKIAYDYWNDILSADAVQIDGGAIVYKFDVDYDTRTVEFNWEDEFLFYRERVTLNGLLEKCSVKNGVLYTLNEDGESVSLRPMRFEDIL